MILRDWLINRRVGPGAITRAGEVHSALSGGDTETFITSDSDLGSGPDPGNKLYRVPGPNWQLPEIAGRLLDTAVWKLEIGYLGEGSDDLGAAWEETWQAGTFARVADDFGARTVQIDNDPGWVSISEALARRLYPLPPPDDASVWEIFGLGGFRLDLVGEVGDPGDELPATILVECRIGNVVPAMYSAEPPVSPGRWDQADLQPVWVLTSLFRAETWIDGLLVSETSIGYFDGTPIGVVGPNDSDWVLSLSIESNQVDA